MSWRGAGNQDREEVEVNEKIRSRPILVFVIVKVCYSSRTHCNHDAAKPLHSNLGHVLNLLVHNGPSDCDFGLGVIDDSDGILGALSTACLGAFPEHKEEGREEDEGSNCPSNDATNGALRQATRARRIGWPGGATTRGTITLVDEHQNHTQKSGGLTLGNWLPQYYLRLPTARC